MNFCNIFNKHWTSESVVQVTRLIPWVNVDSHGSQYLILVILLYPIKIQLAFKICPTKWLPFIFCFCFVLYYLDDLCPVFVVSSTLALYSLCTLLLLLHSSRFIVAREMFETNFYISYYDYSDVYRLLLIFIKLFYLSPSLRLGFWVSAFMFRRIGRHLGILIQNVFIYSYDRKRCVTKRPSNWE